MENDIKNDNNCNCPICTKTEMKKFTTYTCKNQNGISFGITSPEDKDEALAYIDAALRKYNNK